MRAAVWACLGVCLVADGQRDTAIHTRIAGSTRVVLARVTTITSAVETVSGDALIVSTVTVTVEAHYKGSGVTTLTMKIPGGTVAGVTMTSSGFPTLAVNNRLVVFANPDGGLYVPYQGGQGLLLVNNQNVVQAYHGLTAEDVRRMAQ